MVNSGSFVIETGNDDLRAGSKATVRIVARDGVIYQEEVAHGAKFPNQSHQTKSFTLSTPVEIADIQQIEILFIPDHRDFMNDDEWVLQSLSLTVDDSVSGTTTLYNQSVQHKFESADTWSSGTLATYNPITSTSISTGTLVIGTGDDDLRQKSQVWIRFVTKSGGPRTFEVARGTRLPDRTAFTTPFTLVDDNGALASIPIADIMRIDVSFVPDRSEYMHDDQWWFETFKVIVNDGSVDGVVLYDGVPHHKFEHIDTWTTGILPTYERLNDSIVSVTDDAGAPVMGAEVFVDDVLVGRTDRLGQLLVSPTIDPSKRVTARLRVHEQDYYRSHHDTDSTKNWNYRVYLTNVDIESTGTAMPTGTRDGADISIQLTKENTLIGVNLLATTDWDATAANLDALRQTFLGASEFLYNATDGQFFIDHVKVIDSSRMWDDSDYRILANRSFGAVTTNQTGGFLGQNIAGTAMYLARTDVSATFVHEFGHFGLDVDDEYANDDPNKHCTALPPGPFAAGMPQASCMMWSEERAPKLCSKRMDNPHVHGLRQGDMACWDKLVSRYQKPEWKLRTPADRDQVPSTIRWATGPIAMAGMLEMVAALDNIDSANLIGDCALTIMSSAGLLVPGAFVTLKDASGRAIPQGKADRNGQILIVGVHAGDQLWIDTSNGYVHEQTVPAGAASLTIILTE
jgi:hypothetical protein